MDKEKSLKSAVLELVHVRMYMYACFICEVYCTVTIVLYIQCTCIIVTSVAPTLCTCIQQFAYMPIFHNPNCLYADPIRYCLCEIYIV